MANKTNMTLRFQRPSFQERVDEPNSVTYEAIEAVERDEYIYGPFDSISDLMEALHS